VSAPVDHGVVRSEPAAGFCQLESDSAKFAAGSSSHRSDWVGGVVETLVSAGEWSEFAARSEGMADSGQLVAVGTGSAQDSGGAHDDVWPHRVPEAGVTASGDHQ
jgi:hypothetical protein